MRNICHSVQRRKGMEVTFLYRGCTLHFVDLHSEMTVCLSSVPFVDDDKCILHREVPLQLMLAVANLEHANTDAFDIYYCSDNVLSLVLRGHSRNFLGLKVAKTMQDIWTATI